MSKAKKRVSKQELVELVAKERKEGIKRTKPILEKNLFKFNRFVMEMEKGKEKVEMAQVHKDICEFIDNKKKRKKLLMIPRGHLKSTVVTVGYTLQSIVRDPQVRILIGNATYGLACSFLSDIKRHLKFNEKIKMFWGDLTVGTENWTRDKITLAHSTRKEPTVTAMGVESNMTSQHYDLIILDDVVNEDYVNTMDQINKTINFYKECLNLLEPGGEMIIIGTRWHDSDLYGWILDPDNNVQPDFDIFIRKAYEGSLDEDGEFTGLFPKKYSREHLKRLYEQQGPYVFSSQYLNDPVAEQDATFQRGWFQYYEQADMKGRLMTKFTTIDPAISIEQDADFTAIVTVGVDEFRNIYILDIRRMRMRPKEILDNIFEVWHFFQPVMIGIEDVAFQKSLQYSLSEEMNRRGEFLPITPLKPGGRAKDQRIKGLQPLYANGKVYHCKTIKNMRYLEDELVRFPRGKHDDIIDALAYMLELNIFPPARRKTKLNRRSRYIYA